MTSPSEADVRAMVARLRETIGQPLSWMAATMLESLLTQHYSLGAEFDQLIGVMVTRDAELAALREQVAKLEIDLREMTAAKWFSYGQATDLANELAIAQSQVARQGEPVVFRWRFKDETTASSWVYQEAHRPKPPSAIDVDLEYLYAAPQVARQIPRKPTTKDQNMTKDELKTAVFESLGAASVCWEKMSGTGVFESTRCTEIGNALWAKIESALDAAPIDDQVARDKQDAATRAMTALQEIVDAYDIPTHSTDMREAIEAARTVLFQAQAKAG